MSSGKVIFVDDEHYVRQSRRQTLELARFEVTTLSNGEDALHMLDAHWPGILVTDIKMPGMNGLELLERVVHLDKDIPVVLVTGHGDIPMAVKAMQLGAYDFIEKPCPTEQFLEIAAGHMLHPPKPGLNALAPSEVGPMLRRGGPAARTATNPARFRVGDRVRAKTISPPTHTRLPRYIRGHVGIIEHLHGCHVFPDSNALGQGEEPHWLYTVTFAGTDLWPDAPDRRLKVSVDAWEPYLEAIDAA